MSECCNKKKERTQEEYKSLINRLNRIEGQIRGIKGMVERREGKERRYQRWGKN